MSASNAPVSLRRRPRTPELAFVGATAFASGFFLLTVVGRELPPGAYLIVLGSALVLTLPLLALTMCVAALESALGRAWASGFHVLSSTARTRAGTSDRAWRYAGYLWLANGGALWVAALASRF